MMKCQKCTGTVWVETDRNTQRFYDLVCVNCGWRKQVDTSTDAFGKWLRYKMLYKDNNALFWVERRHIGRRTLLERDGGRWRIVFEHDIRNERPTLST